MMAETLGSLCDLTIVKLKQWHSEDAERLKSLAVQEQNLRDEIDEFINAAIAGKIQLERLRFAANKVYKQQGNEVSEVEGSIAEVFSQLAAVNCNLWHVNSDIILGLGLFHHLCLAQNFPLLFFVKLV